MPTSPLAHAIAALANRQSLSERHTTDVFAAVMRGEATPAQIGALLRGLRVKGGPPEEAAAAAAGLREACLTFLFAPAFHPAMKHAGPVRRELAVPSVLNLLGPLATPAGVRRQVVGVADADRAPLVAGALARLGAEHALVVHGRIGMDEIAPQGITDVWEVRSGGGGGGDGGGGASVTTWQLDPARYQLAIADVAMLAGEEPPANARRIERLLADGGGRHDAPARAAVLPNAAAALYVAGLAASQDEGVARARTALEAGTGPGVLEGVRRASASISE